MDLPDDVVAIVIRGIGTYIRESPQQELPANLRRFRSFRPQALTSHRKALLAAFEDQGLRARVAHWIDNDKPPLSKEDARLLKIAAAREDGWEDELRAASVGPRKDPTPQKPADDSRLDAEREKVRKAKEDAKRAREELRQAQQQSSARIAELESTVAELRSRAEAAERAAEGAKKEAERAADRADRAERKARTAVDKHQIERDAARKEVRELKKQLASTKPPPKGAPARAAGPKRKSSAEPKLRRPLRVPKGRLEDDPKTLEAWLTRDDVLMVIDGYNVAKADGGYEDLQLESQRERLVDAVFTLAKMTDTQTLIVFDAQLVPGRRTRRAKRPVTIEWSNTGEIADDYIIDRLKELPQSPVILVTNDKELQQRGRELKATVATSQQLLGLLR